MTEHTKESQRGKTIIVTGANSGIGYYAALDLGKAGAHVIVAARSEERGQKAVEEMKKADPEGKYELELLDVSDLESVREFAKRFLARGIPLDTLINNAGVMQLPERQLSKEGVEMQWATNVVGPFALTGLLMPKLKESKSPRVVNVSSVAADASVLTKETLDLTEASDKYDTEKVYNDTKMANQALTLALNKRYPQVMALAVHPGVASTNLFNNNKFKDMASQFAAPSAGCQTTVRAVTDVAAKAGMYFGPKERYSGPPVVTEWSKTSLKEDLQEALWDACVKITRVTF
uniref:Short-chain dehydrogenase/reductase SDR n=1 Tax=Chromera velia CCMP2878 TaxID=1169474 RepID=A0A0G4HUY7_9ALVE|eukprot:Cvel_1394.t1-p1 / transcript=Cvel_1394.t1 / gene=Cvel_1394 / organism=Chromera_velia_CCMP2878 / gene_product=Retinol dehydrogenase 13, putative / transcript_product=Retinol dehydrogenase 13, putative / location=Cvel_scaffold48:122905-123981(+) / protein_length=289 / sequence_SO=supercontig / SO=protein_coding / is_pseudo=false